MTRIYFLTLCASFLLVGPRAFAAADSFYMAEFPFNDRYTLGIRVDAKGIVIEVGFVQKYNEKEWRPVVQSVDGGRDEFIVNWDQQKGSRILMTKTKIKISTNKDIKEVRVLFNWDKTDKEKKEVVARPGTEEESKMKFRPINK